MILILHVDAPEAAREVQAILEAQKLSVTVQTDALDGSQIVVPIFTAAFKKDDGFCHLLERAREQGKTIMPVVPVAAGPGPLKDRRKAAHRSAVPMGFQDFQVAHVDGGDYSEVKAKLLRDAYRLIHPDDTQWVPPPAQAPRLNPLRGPLLLWWLMTDHYHDAIAPTYRPESILAAAAWFASTALWLVIAVLLLLTDLSATLTLLAVIVGWGSQGALRNPDRHSVTALPLLLLIVLVLWHGSPVAAVAGLLAFVLGRATVAAVCETPGVRVAFSGGQVVLLLVTLCTAGFFIIIESGLASELGRQGAIIATHIGLVFFMCLGLYFATQAGAFVVVRLLTLPLAAPFQFRILASEDDLPHYLETAPFFFRMLMVTALALAAFVVLGQLSFENVRQDVDEALIDEAVQVSDAPREEVEDMVNIFNLSTNYHLPGVWQRLAVGGALGLAGFWLAGLLTHYLLEREFIPSNFYNPNMGGWWR